MTLNERELFEASMKSKGILDLDFVQYHELSNKYLIQNGLSGEDFRTALDASHVVNVAWMMWQEKAKAQAVPEGYALVSKDKLHEWYCMANRSEELGCPECYESRGYAHNLACELNEASESGAEG